MAETVQGVIKRYLEDTIAAERNFENALRSFGKAGVQEPTKGLLSSFAEKAKTQHERLTSLLKRRGGSPSAAKTALAQMLAFSPLSAQIGQGAAEKNTQHLMVTFAAAAAEMAMYESLAEAADQANDQETAHLARTLQSEERQDHEQVWSLLRPSARDAFQAQAAGGKNPRERINAYLEDAIAAEKSFETQLEGFSKEGNNPEIQNLFAQHARETRSQYERLTSRLQALGGSTSTLKSFLAHVFNLGPQVAKMGHDETERMTQNLMMAYSVENAEIAMYESLAEVARTAGDTETEQLALAIQQQEKETAQKVWAQLAPTARRAVTAVAAARA